jgi:hypothetical protein
MTIKVDSIKPVKDGKKKSNLKRRIFLGIFLVLTLFLSAVFFWFYNYSKITPTKFFSFFFERIDDNKKDLQDMKRKAKIAQKEVQKECVDAKLVMVMPVIKPEQISEYSFPVDVLKKQDNVDVKETYSFVFDSEKCKKGKMVFISFKDDKIIKILNLVSTAGLKEKIIIGDTYIGYKKFLLGSDDNGGTEFKNKNLNITIEGPMLLHSKILGLSWWMAYRAEKDQAFFFAVDLKTGQARKYEGSGSDNTRPDWTK